MLNVGHIALLERNPITICVAMNMLLLRSKGVGAKYVITFSSTFLLVLQYAFINVIELTLSLPLVQQVITTLPAPIALRPQKRSDVRRARRKSERRKVQREQRQDSARADAPVLNWATRVCGLCSSRQTGCRESCRRRAETESPCLERDRESTFQTAPRQYNSSNSTHYLNEYSTGHDPIPRLHPAAVRPAGLLAE
jgi:hypothetical protein